MLVANDPKVASWLERMLSTALTHDVATIAWIKDDEIMMAAAYEDYTGACCEASIVVKNGAIVPKAFLHGIFYFPFVDLGCVKILGRVATDNAKAIRFNHKLGFMPVAKIDDVFPDADLFIMEMKRENCRWIGKRA